MTEKKVNTHDRVSGEQVEVPAHPVAQEPSAKEMNSLSLDRLKHEYGNIDELPGASLPVLTQKKFHTDPTEGQQGAFSKIVELDERCPVCGYDRGTVTVEILAGVHILTCNACGNDIK
jgi:hypothetical protein